MKKRNGLKIILKIGMKSQERRTHFRYKDTHTHTHTQKRHTQTESEKTEKGTP